MPCVHVLGCSVLFQGSPNQVKWATSSPWFQWSRPISVKKRSFFKSVFMSIFFPPIIILFLQYSHKRSSHVPEIWPIQGLMFNILFHSLIASFLRSLCSMFVLWKVGEHAEVGKETLKFGSIFGSLPDLPSLRP
jgi:hypothetical protein